VFEHHRLLDSGARTRGVVIDKHVTSRSPTALTTASYILSVRVRFDDGSVNEFQSDRLQVDTVGQLCPGDTVPVRYDSDAHSKMVVDTEALVAARAEALDRGA